MQLFIRATKITNLGRNNIPMWSVYVEVLGI